MQYAPSRMGQPSSVPRICSMPSTCESSRPTVTASWFTVPSPPRRLSGAISDMYIGTSEVFSPVSKQTDVSIPYANERAAIGTI